MLPEDAATRPPTLILFGRTGDGKSNLATWLLGNHNLFKESRGVEKCTRKTVVKAGNCFGHPGLCQEQWRVVDTPGLGDCLERDVDTLEKLLEFQESLQYVNAFILVVSAHQNTAHGLPSALENAIHVLRTGYGEAFWNNLCVVFTKWHWDNEFDDFDVNMLNRRRTEWQAMLLQYERQYVQHTTVLPNVRFFAVDLPSLERVISNKGTEGVEKILLDSSTSPLTSTTGDQLRDFHSYVHSDLAFKPVSLSTEARIKCRDYLKRLLAEEKAKQERPENGLGEREVETPVHVAQIVCPPERPEERPIVRLVKVILGFCEIL